MKIIRISTLVLVLLCPFLLWAQNEQPSGARRMGLGQAYVGVKADFWQLFLNPAGIAGVDGPQAGAFFEQRFLMKGFSSGSAGYVQPFKKRHFAGFDVSAYGFDSFNETRIGLSYATTVMEKLSIGAKVNFSNTSIKDYGSASAFYLDLGLLLRITEELNLGARIHNPTQAKLQKNVPVPIPGILNLGLSYQVTDQVLLVADIENQVNFPTSFRAGIEYSVLEFLRIRAGGSTAPVSFSAGFGLDFKGLEFDFSNSFDSNLGYTPTLSLSYKFNTPNKE